MSWWLVFWIWLLSHTGRGVVNYVVLLLSNLVIPPEKRQ